MSAAIEEYLKMIYLLYHQYHYIRVTDIAHYLNCSKPSVNRALKVLKEKGFLCYEAYGEILLTKQGEKVASDIVRRHETLKAFLIQVLEVDQETADKEANSMKHAISEETVEKLEEYIKGIIDVSKLACDYNPHSNKCKECVKIAAREQYQLKGKK